MPLPLLLPLCLLALPIAVVGCGGSAETGTPAAQPLEIIVSGDTAGWIVPCGCTSNQSGGLLRRGTYVRRQRERHAAIVLDTGGAPGGTSPYERARLEAILAGERAMNVAAHNLGGPEIKLGPLYLRQLAAKSGMPLISANAADADGRLLAAAHVLLSAAGRKLAIVGVVSPRYATAEVKISEPRDAVLAVRESLKGQFDTLIVLAYLPEEELRAFAAALPEADLIVGGPTGQAIAPIAVGPALLASATNKGKFLVSFQSDEPRSGWRGSIVELNEKFADDPAQQNNVAAFRRKLAERDFTAAESGLAASLPGGLPADYRVAGSAACRECHVKDYEVWESSGHAHAWQTLVTDQSHVDSACQQCHTTLFGWPGGFASARRSSGRVNVGCESCHGPSQAHAADPAQRTPLLAREQCQTCHDRENSPQFDFASYWQQIIHGKSPAQ